MTTTEEIEIIAEDNDLDLRGIAPEVIAEFISDYAMPLDWSSVRTALECYIGRFDSEADFAQDRLADLEENLRSKADEMGLEAFRYCIKIDYEDAALIMQNTEGWDFAAYGPYGSEFFTPAP